jgi:hypothetical protein
VSVIIIFPTDGREASDLIILKDGPVNVNEIVVTGKLDPVRVATIVFVPAIGVVTAKVPIALSATVICIDAEVVERGDDTLRV